MEEDRVHARLEIPCLELGFRPPPHDCHLRAMEVRGTWVVYVWSATREPEDLLAWIREHGEFEVRGPQSMDRVLAVETEQLPDPWEDLFARFEIQSAALGIDGSAMISLRGPRERVRALIEAFGETSKLEQVVQAPGPSAPSGEDPLTEIERDAILAAYEKGYFNVPRKIRLEELAEHLGKSTGSLSTLLRRGTQRLVASYAQGLTEGPPFPLGTQEVPTEEPAAPGRKAGEETS